MTTDARLPDNTRPCDVCRTPTPLSVLRPEVFQEWDALCPRCWAIATRQTALERARADATREAALLRLTRA